MTIFFAWHLLALNNKFCMYKNVTLICFWLVHCYFHIIIKIITRACPNMQHHYVYSSYIYYSLYQRCNNTISLLICRASYYFNQTLKQYIAILWYIGGNIQVCIDMSAHCIVATLLYCISIATLFVYIW